MSTQAQQFAVFSLSRSGSTALYRILTLGSTTIAYEPDFANAWHTRESLIAHCNQDLAGFDGIKHVWDPNGWPFANKSHLSTLDSLSRSHEWISVNGRLASCMRQAIVLRRRNQLARVVSDLMGQHTGLWGHLPDLPFSEGEAADYKTQLASHSVGPLDIRIIDWYVRYASTWEEAILSMLPPESFRVVHYEDLFDPKQDCDARAQLATDLGSWLGVSISASDDRLIAILRSSGKHNDLSSYRHITNLDEIVAAFGDI